MFVIDSQEQKTLFQKIKRKNNLEATTDEWIKRFCYKKESLLEGLEYIKYEFVENFDSKLVTSVETTIDELRKSTIQDKGLIYVNDLIERKEAKYAISEMKKRLGNNKDLRYNLDYITYMNRLSHYPAYEFPNLLSMSIEMGLIAIEDDLFLEYEQGDVIVNNSTGSYLVELCSSLEDLKKKSLLFMNGDMRIMENQKKAELNGLKFRILFIQSNDKDSFHEYLSSDEVSRIKWFHKTLKSDGVKIRKLKLDKKEFFTPVKYFLNVEENELNLKNKLRSIITYLSEIT